MAYRSDVAYVYDGSFEGLLSCVFRSFYSNEEPFRIFSPDNIEPVLYPLLEVKTDKDKSDRVLKSIHEKISHEAAYFTGLVYLSCNPYKEVLILRFLRLGYRVGAKVLELRGDETVNEIHKAVRFIQNEGHFFKEFLRFSDTGAGLVAKIRPKNIVLPLIREHYCDRLPEETFLIFDLTHSMALCYSPYKARIIPADWVETPPENEDEAFYRKLWQHFYIVAGVEERFNPVCRRGHMPKRYWDCLTEYDQLLLTEKYSRSELIGKMQGAPDRLDSALNRPEIHKELSENTVIRLKLVGE